MTAGDARFSAASRRLAEERSPARAIRAYRDTDLVQILAAQSKQPYMANVAASELLNRLRRKNATLAVTGEGLCALDLSGKVVFANPAAERILGPALWDPDRTFHAQVHVHLVNTPLEAVCPLALAAQARRGVKVEEDTFSRAAGDVIPVSFTIDPVLRGGVPDGWVVAFRDTSLSRTLVASLEQREERLEAALAMAGVCRWDWDARNDLFLLDDEGYRRFGIQPHEFGGRLRSLLALLPEVDRRLLVDRMVRACESRSEFSLDHRLRRADGDPAVLQTRGRFVYGDDGQAVAAWGTIQDLSLLAPACLEAGAGRAGGLGRF